ncbi:MAG: NAD(P)H-quinone oxidoreductase subunit F [Pseudanabaena sp.]|jgi:NAD(P)H-quinone oxidoreductase subunit 5|nr:NAD(P)H-quinone oxidoreductase subunit F [Pseudanabaena sp. M090S1SP2A07QC]MCA6506000.1 NAD(P)H-quinone oxidoreductase subunit F [Pseudanabaena sp. M172S2SP2A07QC]MCA6522412.1 NAD(P)H-quinone oxidoreductase subunit F [Pseudanabaena sp. M051S1SP2A07QC]MCA6525494.1 NAD(P)H-quinone oxidoreductase subunit F [Pseudanabaena sp. M179S2SP2A07QC]MCA6529944.1 NAD(P)H-quinone oxidoreductase subunit F [Pseudanabaena sp. M125S2SP2A07QC]MCA6532882.1 NAD(P)H-quinone oxidoreductase subunit F [Pseudanabaena
MILETAWLLPCYGLLGAGLTLPWSLRIVRRTGPRPAAYLNILMTVLALVHSCWLLTSIWGQPSQQFEFIWFQAFDLNLACSFDISTISVGASVMIAVMSLISQVYGLGSLETDWAIARFCALIGFFEAAITGIAFSDSLFFSYALLEMLTLSTYLLVGFWYAQPLVVTAARDAFWTKRVGDLFLLMAVVTLSNLTDSLNFSDLKTWADAPQTIAYFAEHQQFGTLLGLALIAGPLGKCAQFPLHLWLDEAMEGPNPASILRNSVVVGAGAYVLIKFQPILALFPLAAEVSVVIGAITAIGTSLVAIAQIDMKRALSHSTSAYLGLVFIAVGMQQPDLALGLLFSHGISKALLFLSSGAVMISTMTQDLTEMGGIKTRMPASLVGFIVGSLGLVAFIPFGGFWTLLRWEETFWNSDPWLIAIALLVNSITAFGLMRMFALVFLGPTQPKTRRAPEVAWPVALPLVSLTIITLLVPILLPSWKFVDIDLDTVHIWGNVALSASGLLGFGLGAYIYIKPYETGSSVPMLPKATRQVWKAVQDLLAYDLYVQAIYKYTVVLIVGGGSKFLAWIDRYLVDGSVNFVGFASIFSGESLKYTVTGRLQQYVLTIMIGLILIGFAAFYGLQ